MAKAKKSKSSKSNNKPGKAFRAFKPSAKSDKPAKLVKKGPKGKLIKIKPVVRRRKVSLSPLVEIKAKPVVSLHSKDVPAALTDSQIQKFREILTVKRDELSKIVHKKKEEEIEDINTGDEADVATRSVEKEMLFELTDNENQTLEMVEAALRRIEKGVFGRCESCRKPIGKMRLEVMPWARYCIQCQAQQEVAPMEGPAY